MHSTPAGVTRLSCCAPSEENKPVALDKAKARLEQLEAAAASEEEGGMDLTQEELSALPLRCRARVRGVAGPC